MKLTYHRTSSSKNMHTGQIETHRFYAEDEIDVANMDEPVKQHKMTEVTKNLHVAVAIMRKEIFLDNPDNPNE